MLSATRKTKFRSLICLGNNLAQIMQVFNCILCIYTFTNFINAYMANTFEIMVPQFEIKGHISHITRTMIQPHLVAC